MLFNCFEFILFGVSVVVIYYLISDNKWRKIFLLVASYYFYACWNVAFLAILLFETLLSYTVPRLFKGGRKQQKGQEPVCRGGYSLVDVVVLL